MKVSVIGCGWLGTPLAEELIQNGHQVLGSTTSANKLNGLRERGIQPILFKLDPMPIGENFNQLFEADLLIINIPPSSRTHPPHFYEEQIKYLKYRLESSLIKKVVFISSTSYYPNTNS
ncbi:MAG TPA: NAD(P)-binding domain-containing protein, partial [Roseivirga sp.]